MANLIDKTYFIDEINLPSSMLTGDTEIITAYINKYEKDILIKLLGYNLYKALKEQIEAGTYSAPWKGLIEGAEYDVEYGNDTYLVKWGGLINAEKVSLIAYYVYYNIVRDTVTSTSGIGEMLNNVENGSRITPADKQIFAYNRMVELMGGSEDTLFSPTAYRYLEEHESDFDKWLFTELFPLNTFCI